MAQSRSDLIENVVKGSFHQGDTSAFSPNSVGHKCVPNCVIAGIYNSIVPVSRWSRDSLHTILGHGDKLYNSIKKTTDFLQVNDIGPQILHSKIYTIFVLDKRFLGESERSIT